VVIHQNIAMDQNFITVVIVLKDMEKSNTVPILHENVLPFVSSVGNVIQYDRIFYPNRPTQGQTILKIKLSASFQGLIPIILIGRKIKGTFQNVPFR